MGLRLTQAHSQSRLAFSSADVSGADCYMPPEALAKERPNTISALEKLAVGRESTVVREVVDIMFTGPREHRGDGMRGFPLDDPEL